MKDKREALCDTLTEILEQYVGDSNSVYFIAIGDEPENEGDQNLSIVSNIKVEETKGFLDSISKVVDDQKWDIAANNFLD